MPQENRTTTWVSDCQVPLITSLVYDDRIRNYLATYLSVDIRALICVDASGGNYFSLPYQGKIDLPTCLPPYHAST